MKGTIDDNKDVRIFDEDGYHWAFSPAYGTAWRYIRPLEEK